MSIAIAPSSMRALAAADGATNDETQQADLPPVIRDGQGREFRLQVDPVTGAPQYRHASQQRDEAGNTLDLEILITFAADGGFARRTTQHLNLANGDQQRQVATETHAADGTLTGETVESFTKEGSATTTEYTVGTYAGGELVKRETDLTQRDEATDAKTGEHTVVEAKIHGTWDEQGAPITDETVPHVDRTETQRITSPGQGINKDTDRTLTYTAHAAGPLGALQHDEYGTLVVRFEGRNGQYLERELHVPVDQATGAPKMDLAETVRTDDKQNLVNKGLMQARIWGGFASNLSWVIGLTFARGSLGRGFLGFSAAAAAAQLTGEVHAVATRRNDGDWARVATSAYDTLLTGLLVAATSKRPDARIQTMSNQQRLGLGALGAGSLALNLGELNGTIGARVGADGLTNRLLDATRGAGLLPAPAGPAVHAPTLDTGTLQLDERFDAAAALLR